MGVSGTAAHGDGNGQAIPTPGKLAVIGSLCFGSNSHETAI